MKLCLSDMPSTLVPLLVLDDGETYCPIDGCSVILVTNEQYGSLCDETVRIRDIRPAAEILLRDVSY